MTSRAGLFAEFDAAPALLEAAGKLREHGVTKLDGHTPFLVPGAEAAFGLPRSRLPFVVLAFGLAGAGGAYALQAWTVAVDYPLNVGGRPPYAPPIYVPITFEMGVLAAAFSAFFAILGFAKLPRLWDPVFEVEGFERATADRFWIVVDASDPKYDRDAVVALLEGAGALRVLTLPGVSR